MICACLILTFRGTLVANKIFHLLTRQENNILHCNDTVQESEIFALLLIPREMGKNKSCQYSRGTQPDRNLCETIHSNLNSSKLWKSLELQQNFVVNPYNLSQKELLPHSSKLKGLGVKLQNIQVLKLLNL